MNLLANRRKYSNRREYALRRLVKWHWFLSVGGHRQRSFCIHWMIYEVEPNDWRNKTASAFHPFDAGFRSLEQWIREHFPEAMWIHHSFCWIMKDEVKIFLKQYVDDLHLSAIDIVLKHLQETRQMACHLDGHSIHQVVLLSCWPSGDKMSER